MSDHQHDENCAHGDDHEEDVFLVTDEEGQEHEMVIVYTFESQNQAYAVMIDRNDPEADGMIFRVEEQEDEAFLVNIEDDEEWDRVSAIYNQIVEEESKE